MKSLRRFLHDTRAGATAIVAAAVTVMTVGAAALIVDHVWLVDQRDVLKAAADAGSVAATLEMHRQLVADSGISDAELTEALEAVAKRYVVLNLNYLPEARLTNALSTLVVEVTPNRSAGNVHVHTAADLGGTLFSRILPLLGNYAGPGNMRVASIVESTKVPVEVVLAIDVSKSMSRALDGTPYVSEDASRMGVVKEAALALVGLLDPSVHHRIAVGVLPWHLMVRLDDATEENWVDNHWAEYPRTRYYATPYGAPSGMTAPEGVTQSVAASAPQSWWGCLDEHRITNGAGHAALPPTGDLLATPATMAFAQGFFPPLRCTPTNAPRIPCRAICTPRSATRRSPRARVGDSASVRRNTVAMTGGERRCCRLLRTEVESKTVSTPSRRVGSVPIRRSEYCGHSACSPTNGRQPGATPCIRSIERPRKANPCARSSCC